jgi:major membrane immunogen (membrane-anchored lipoprotein)
MKKLFTVLLILAMAIGLSGCSKYISIGSVENNSEHKMSASYMLYSGTKETELTVDDGETVTVTVKVNTKKGSLDAYIYNEDDEYSYEGHDIQTSDFTVTLSEPGDYTIKVDASRHKGSFSFSW